MVISYKNFGLWMLATVAILSIPQQLLAQGATPAPGTKCWQYSPTYCQNVRVTMCNGNRCVDCEEEGKFCQDLLETDSSTYPELIANAVVSEIGFKNLSKPISSQVRCGVRNVCRCTYTDMDDQGRPIYVCSNKFVVGAIWMFSNASLDTSCQPPPPPTGGGVGTGGSVGGA